ncbi:hypothetical protein Y032_0031g2400 [Ancylostoma ceylanicum]|uniref:Uncharacterized protein n=1 Tax=Ancylostoma ceylanicum TaxID=53326 RepID=A0A016UR57_9BILA|nr:hypothetical protein Y032_0031g2400 [Ancylostoma ceylanicum]
MLLLSLNTQSNFQIRSTISNVKAHFEVQLDISALRNSSVHVPRGSRLNRSKPVLQEILCSPRRVISSSPKIVSTNI